MRTIRGGFYQATADEFEDIVDLESTVATVDAQVEVIPVQWIVPTRRLYTQQGIVSSYTQGQKHAPIIVNGCGQILDGHKRFAAMRRLGFEGISVIIDYTAKIEEIDHGS